MTQGAIRVIDQTVEGTNRMAHALNANMATISTMVVASNANLSHIILNSTHFFTTDAISVTMVRLLLASTATRVPFQLLMMQLLTSSYPINLKESAF